RVRQPGGTRFPLAAGRELLQLTLMRQAAFRGRERLSVAENAAAARTSTTPGAGRYRNHTSHSGTGTAVRWGASAGGLHDLAVDRRERHRCLLREGLVRGVTERANQ